MGSKIPKVIRDRVEAMISEKDIRALTLEMMKSADQGFWASPSSISGKYHPKDERRKWGRILHVLRVVKTADHLARAFELNGWERDVFLAAMFVHDCGIPVDVKPHSSEIHDTRLREITDHLRGGQLSYFTIIAIVEAHGGQWSTKEMSWKYRGKMEELGHIADFLSSREDILVDVSEWYQIDGPSPPLREGKKWSGGIKDPPTTPRPVGNPPAGPKREES